MPNVLSIFLSELGGIFPGVDGDSDDEELINFIDAARQDWVSACAFFNEVSDPDLIDMAIYAMEAAEKKYIYLVKMARLKGVHLSGYPDTNVQS